MTQKADLQAAITANPDDDSPRLVFADWLLERGDPRGELISLQCASEQLDPADPQRQALEASANRLLDRYGTTWTEPIRDRLGGHSVRWRRGMIEHVTVKAAPLLERPELLLELCPLVRSVGIEAVGDRLPRVLEIPWIERLRALDLSNGYLEDEAASLLASSDRLAGLESLELGSNAIADDGAAALSESAFLGRLVYLGLETNRIEDDGAVAIAENRALTSLRELDLSEVNLGSMWAGNDIGPEGGAALAGLSLTRLFLSGNTVGNETLEALAAVETAVKMKELRLARAGATDGGLRAIAGSPRMSELRLLNLAANTFTDEGARELLSSPYLSGELELSLRVDPARQQLTTETIEALLERFPALEI
jgi:uncharacterized protein (TIGR02996 family)